MLWFWQQVHLIEGIIDQVEGTVHVSWVQPRVLGIPQIKSLRDRLDNWLDKVHTALLSVEAETPDLVASWFFPHHLVLDFLSAYCNNFANQKANNDGWLSGETSSKSHGQSRQTLYASLSYSRILFRETSILFFIFFLKGAACVILHLGFVAYIRWGLPRDMVNQKNILSFYS
jgi:hypothetical protein